MFSQKNKRFTLLAILAAGTVGLTSILLTILIVTNHGKESLIVTAFVGGGIAYLFDMLRAEGRGKESAEERKVLHAEIKTLTNGGLKDAVKSVVEEAGATPLAPDMMPKTRAELDAMLKTICKETAEEAARTAIREMREEMRRKAKGEIEPGDEG